MTSTFWGKRCFQADVSLKLAEPSEFKYVDYEDACDKM